MVHMSLQAENLQPINTLNSTEKHEFAVERGFTQCKSTSTGWEPIRPRVHVFFHYFSTVHTSDARWALEREALVKTSIRTKVKWLQRLHPQNQRKVCLLLPALETSRRGVGVVTIAT